jgi:hypothetical protein
MKKSQAPEKMSDLSTFRALANNSARQAVGRSEVKVLRDTAAVNLVLSGIAFGVGTFLLTTASAVISLPTIGGSLIMIAATWWGSRTANQLLEAIRELGNLPSEE